MKGSLVWRDSTTIPAAGYEYLRFFPRKDVGIPVKVYNVNLENNTRPAHDPRACFAWKGYMQSPHGNAATDGLIVVGYACSYGNLTKRTVGLRLTLSDMIGFKFYGETDDAVKASVIYEVIEE